MSMCYLYVDPTLAQLCVAAQQYIKVSQWLRSMINPMEQSRIIKGSSRKNWLNSEKGLPVSEWFGADNQYECA